MTANQVQTEHQLDPAARRVLNETAIHRVPDRTLKTHDLGFHGDRYLLDLVDSLIGQVDCYIETGSSVGNTLAYVAHRYPRLQCLSCEPGETAWAIARDRIADCNHAQVRCETSPEFIEHILKENWDLQNSTPLFFLDAHGHGYYWPLWDEIELIAREFPRAFVLVDDLQVPNQAHFKFDRFGELECTPESILPHLPRHTSVQLVQPAYSDRTSTHHPLTGYGLYYWEIDFSLPKHLHDRFSITTIIPADATQ